MTQRAAARRPRSNGRGTLFLLTLLLGLSGLLRVGSGAVHALDSSTDAPAEPAADAELCEPDGGALAMLSELRDREARLAEREAQLANAARAVTLARAEVETRLGALDEAEARLAATLALADEAADQDVARLVAVYEQMKPKDSAALFAEMEPGFAAGFLARMRPEAAAALMAGLEPRTAYAISILLAGRNAAAPEE